MDWLLMVFIATLGLNAIVLIFLEKYKWFVSCKLFIIKEIEDHIDRNASAFKKSLRANLEKIVGKDEAEEYPYYAIHYAFLDELFFTLNVKSPSCILLNPFAKSARDIVNNKKMYDTIVAS